jgi:hypothetical protein
MTTTFKHLGYFLEYFVNGKSIGTRKITEPDRAIVGYEGRMIFVTEVDIHLDNKKRIKAGTEVKSVLYPLCGRIVKK